MVITLLRVRIFTNHFSSAIRTIRTVINDSIAINHLIFKKAKYLRWFSNVINRVAKHPKQDLRHTENKVGLTLHE
jgi:hypothetical protein